MSIYTLGTSHGDSTFSRFNSSTAYETKDGTIYLVDAGAPCEALIRRKGLLIQNVKAAFITHMHDDHAGGISGLLKQVSKYKGLRRQQFNIYLPEETAIEPIKLWMSVLHENVDSIMFNSVDDGVIFDDENLRVSAIRTCHLRTKGRCEGTPCSFAYTLLFKKENINVLHTGDLRHDFSDFPQIAQNEHFDVCLCEATHYRVEDALPKLKQSKFDKLIFIRVNDCWHNRITPGWEVDRGEQRLIDSYSELPYSVSVAHDGDEFVF